MADFHDDVRERLTEALADRAAVRVVNLCGPLGSGKTRLAGEAARQVADAVHLIDGVDSAEAAGRALTVLETLARAESPARLLVVGRRPIRSWPGWGRVPVRTLRLALWSSRDVRELGRSFGISDPAGLDLLVDLAGGLPLAADVLCRALCEAPAEPRGRTERPDPAAIRGGLADRVSQAFLARLETELTGPPPTDILHLLAALGGADADLLAAAAPVPAGDFDRVSTLSVVDADRLGRTVAEPYRTVFDLAYRWRHPMAADAVLARAAAHRHRQIVATTDPTARGALSERVMRTSAPPHVRRAFFPPSAATFRARTATADDERDVIRLVRQWACMEGLDKSRADRMLEAWMSAPTTGFHLLADAQGRTVGLTNLTPLDAATGRVLEGLLQQHAEEFAPPSVVGSNASAGSAGHLVGMLTAASRRPAALGAVLRRVLNVAIPSGRIVVSTSWPPYRALSANIGLRSVGETRDDLFRCGRRNLVLEHAFTAESIGPWLRRMDIAEDRADSFLEEVRSALGLVRTPRRLESSPLLTLPHLATPAALADFLRRQIEDLAASEVPADAEAGRILRRYFLHRNTGHDALIHEAHLSRATYFRRLDRGVRLIAQAARQPGGPTG